MGALATSPQSSLGELKKWLSLVKFSHSIFALPFALSMAVVVSKTTKLYPAQLFYLILAIVSARTAAMAFNRLIDRHIDAKNPRTQNREIPSGLISVQSVYALLAISALLFLASSAALGMHCFVLSPLVLGVLLFYSWTKRFTSFAHLVLGVCLALAPGGVWYALTGVFAMLPVYLMCGVAFWVAGFDIIYSCQDAQFDASQHLYSIPSRLGVEKALRVSALFHLLSCLFLLYFGYAANLHLGFYIGLCVFAALLFSQHRLVSASDLSRVDLAFFTRNGFASVVFFIATLFGVWFF